MLVRKHETVEVATDADVVAVRQMTRAWATECRFSLVEQTKMVTAASELARNTVNYGRSGTARFELIENASRVGLRLTFEDRGPGIANVEEALRDGFTTGDGLGLGLGGARRLVNDFQIDTTPGQGTRVTVTRWK